MWAIVNKHPAVTRILLEHGADIHLRSETRKLVYNMGGNRSAGSAAADTPLEEVPLGGSTPIMFAARSGDIESARMLVAKGANVNDTEADGNTALIVAAHSGHGTLAAFLLDQGADAKAAPLGYTALHAAVLRGTLRDRGVKNDDPGAGIPLVRALLAHGADPNARVTKGTPVRRWSHDFALLERWNGATPLWLAARFLEIDMIRVLAASGADVHLTARDGTTPLMAAAGTGYSRASGTEAFIKDRRDFSSYNSESFAVATRIPPEEERLVIEALRLLIELGADVNRPNAAGDTAVHAAAALGMNTVISFLSERGADLSAKNKAGRSPIDVARRDDGVGASVVREERSRCCASSAPASTDNARSTMMGSKWPRMVSAWVLGDGLRRRRRRAGSQKLAASGDRRAGRPLDEGGEQLGPVGQGRRARHNQPDHSSEAAASGRTRQDGHRRIAVTPARS